MSRKAVPLFLILLFFALLTIGCATNTPATVQPPNPPPKTSEATETPAPPAQETMRLTVYHATKDAMHLVPEVHVVPKNNHPAQTAVELLLADPKSRDLVRVLPPGTKVRSLTIKDHIAYVDFNDKLIKNNGGGSATELLTVGAIVNTLTEFPEIEKVQILVEGQKVETLSGHMDVSHPLSRSEKIIKKP